MGDAGAQSTRRRMGAGGSVSHLQQHLQSRRCCKPTGMGAVGRGCIGGSALVFQLGVYATPQLYTVLDTTPTHAMTLLSHFNIKHNNVYLLP